MINPNDRQETERIRARQRKLVIGIAVGAATFLTAALAFWLLNRG